MAHASCALPDTRSTPRHVALVRQAKEMKNHYVVSRLMRAERRVKKMQGSIIDQVMMCVRRP